MKHINVHIKENMHLSRYSSWQVGGCADFLAEPHTIEDLQWIEAEARDKNIPITLLGGGTNCLISDAGVRGIVISLRKMVGFSSSVEDGFLKIACLAGTPKLLIMKEFLKHKLAPAVFLSGIPGCMGGGVIMNAGVREHITPCEFSEIVDWVDIVYDQQVVRKSFLDMQWSYRSCQGWQPGMIAHIGLKWPYNPIDDLPQHVKKAQLQRLLKQPLEKPSCGSTFTNPKDVEGLSAGQLIEQTGLKGFQFGQARVSDKHANFIVNLGGAKAGDIDFIIQHIQEKVHHKKGVHLQTEVKYLGEWPH